MACFTAELTELRHDHIYNLPVFIVTKIIKNLKHHQKKMFFSIFIKQCFLWP